MLSSEKYDLHGFFARLEEIHPFSQHKSFEVGCLKKGALVAIWVEFDQRSCRSSEIGPMSLRKNVNKPGLVSVLYQKRCSVVCRAQKSMIFMGFFCHSWRDIPVSATLIIWGWFSQEGSCGCRLSWIRLLKLKSSQIGPISLRKNINKPGLKNSHNNQAIQSRDVATCLKDIWNEGSCFINRL